MYSTYFGIISLNFKKTSNNLHRVRSRVDSACEGVLFLVLLTLWDMLWLLSGLRVAHLESRLRCVPGTEVRFATERLLASVWCDLGINFVS